MTRKSCYYYIVLAVVIFFLHNTIINGKIINKQLSSQWYRSTEKYEIRPKAIALLSPETNDR